MEEPKAHFLDATGQSMLTNAMIKQCCDLCVQTAFRLIDTVYASLRTPYRSSCWHAVYCWSTLILLLYTTNRWPSHILLSDRPDGVVEMQDA